MPPAVSPTPITMVAGPNTAASSGRHVAPSAETQTGVLDSSPVAISAPRATSPPRQRSTDRTWASGSSAASLRQLMPFQAIAASGGTGVVKAGGPSGKETGDASGDGLGAGGD